MGKKIVEAEELLWTITNNEKLKLFKKSSIGDKIPAQRTRWMGY